MDKVTTFLKRKESRSGIEPRSFRLPAERLTARPYRLTRGHVWPKYQFIRHKPTFFCPAAPWGANWMQRSPFVVLILMEEQNDAWLIRMTGNVLYNLYSPSWGQLACSVRFPEKHQISSLLLQVPNSNTIPATVQIWGPNRQSCGRNRPIQCHCTQLHETKPDE